MSLDFSLAIPACSHCGRGETELVNYNYTHNVSPMWRLVGVYDALYLSEGKKASDVLPILREGIETMVSRFEECVKLNPPNLWGDAHSALEWLRKVAAECEEHPNALIRISR